MLKLQKLESSVNGSFVAKNTHTLELEQKGPIISCREMMGPEKTKNNESYVDMFAQGEAP